MRTSALYIHINALRHIRVTFFVINPGYHQSPSFNQLDRADGRTREDAEVRRSVVLCALRLCAEAGGRGQRAKWGVEGKGEGRRAAVINTFARFPIPESRGSI